MVKNLSFLTPSSSHSYNVDKRGVWGWQTTGKRKQIFDSPVSKENNVTVEIPMLFNRRYCICLT